MAFHIELKHVTKRFGEFTALRDFSGDIHAGNRISLLGHNGAGKSTLLNLIATLSKPTSGRIDYHWRGRPITDRREIRARLSYLSHEPMLYPDLTAMENLRFVARLYGRDDSPRNILEQLRNVGMDRYQERLFRTCSRGMQQRLSLARALLPDPALLLLDEPFSGLDGEGTARVARMLRQSQCSWLLVTHDTAQAYEMGDHFWVLYKGKLAHALPKQDVSLAQLRALYRPPSSTGASA